MKIKVIDSVDMFNDMMFKFISLNKDRFKQIDNRILYVGKYIKYTDIKLDLSRYVDSMKDCLAIHFLIARQSPKFLHHNVIIDHKHIYAYLVKAIKTICKSDYMSVSLYMHEYDEDNSAIVNDLSLSVGRDNLDMYEMQHVRLFVN
jgi:hypothetical protein